MQGNFHNTSGYMISIKHTVYDRKHSSHALTTFSEQVSHSPGAYKIMRYLPWQMQVCIYQHLENIIRMIICVCVCVYKQNCVTMKVIIHEMLLNAPVFH
jgi:hypothetical protein